MRFVVAFTVCVVIWLAFWAIGAKAVDASLVPLLLLIGAVAAFTYKPLLHKTIHGDDES